MKFTLRDLLNAAFRYSRALLIFWVVILIAVGVFYSQTRKLYDSKAKILISLGTEIQGKAEYLNGKNVQLLQREQQLHNEQQILESHEVMLTAAKWILGDPAPGSAPPVMDWQLKKARRFFTGEEPEPTFLLRLTSAAMQSFGSLFGTPPTQAERLEGTARELSDHLGVTAVFDSDALDVSFRYRNPEVAQTVLKLIIAAYLEHHIAVFQSNAEASLLKSQLDRSVNQYHDRLGAFSSFMTAHRVYNDDSQANVLVEEREKLKQVLNEAIADGDSAGARLASLKSIDQSLHQFEHYSTTEVRNKQREALLARLDDTSVEEQTILSRHPKGSRADLEEQSKLNELRHLVEQEPLQVVEETEQRRSKASEFVESEIISVTEIQRGEDARIEQLRHDLRNIDNEIADYAQELKGFNSLKLELTFAKQESEQMAQVYVDSRLKTLTSQNAITDISIIDSPTWDTVAATPKKKIIAAASVLLLVVGSFALLFAFIGLDTTVADGATAEGRLGAPVVGTLPVVRHEPETRNFPELFVRENDKEFARIYQSVRERGPEGKIILITESAAKEGASLVGYGLATFLTHYAREKAAFIDRTMHPISESGDAEKDGPTILAWPGQGTAGDGGASDLVTALAKLRQDFGYVVIAAGAVKDVTDLLAISGIVSATFFLVEAGKTRRAAALYNLELLRRYGFARISLILNKRIFYIPGWLMRFV